MNGNAGAAIPDHRGLALVGDADGGDPGGAHAGSSERFARRRERIAPDILRVVLHPAGRRIMLLELTLRDGDVLRRVVEHDAARRGRALIDGEYVASSIHVIPSLPKGALRRAGQKRPNRRLIKSAAGDTPQQRAGDRHPPVILRRGEGLRAPSGEIAEQPRPEVARRVDGPGLQVPGARADGRHQKTDQERPGVGGRRERVEFLRDGENAQHQNSGQHDLVDERMERRDSKTRMREEHSRSPAVHAAAQVVQLIVMIDDR